MNETTYTCDLKSCLLCKDSKPKWLSLIEKHKTNLHFKKKQDIFTEGEKVKGIYFLYTGTAKVHKKWGSEKELILKFVRKGDMMGYRGLSNTKIYPVTATALEACNVCFIDLAFFEEHLRQNHELTYHLMKFYANELQEAEKRMRNLTHMEVKGRVAEALFLLKKQFGQNKEGAINVQLTRQDIASYTGTTYETLFRTMNELLNEKVVKVVGKKITILNERRLDRLLADEELT